MGSSSGRGGSPGRLVIKVGSSLIAGASGEVDRERMATITQQVAEVREQGAAVVIVSSGAIAAGLAPLGLDKRPKDMATLQAAAAVGQRRLMDLYAELLDPLVAAQVLVTRHDMVSRSQYVNARNTLDRLLKLGAIPIVNENDTVATDEIRYGDNDLLAALVANIVTADLLVLLSDVDGVYEGSPHDPGSRLLEQIEQITPELIGGARGTSTLGSGGMASKLEAAQVASLSGVGVVIASGFQDSVLRRIARGESVGTYVAPGRSRASARKLWIAWAPKARGRIKVDEGAVEALVNGNRSLLAAGVDGVEGSFDAGDPVEVIDPSGKVIAKGLVGFDSDELASVAGRRGGREVIHRDQLVIM